MKKSRVLALAMIAVMVFTVFSFASAQVGEYKTADLRSSINLLAVGNWTESDQWGITPSNGGFDVRMINAETHVTVTLNQAVNVEQNPYLGLNISGMPNNAANDWNWAIEYRDRHGNTGTVNAKNDYNTDGWYGNYDGEFHFAGHFSWRKANEEPTLDLASITLTEIRFFARLPEGATFRINSFFLGNLNDGSTPSTPNIPAPPPRNPGTNDTTPYYLVLLGLGALIVAGIVMPKRRNN
jgi:LPXTG-motif cell wall-anchored protein